MLKNKGSLLSEGNYIGVKLISGEEVLCKIGKIENGEVELIRPHYITPSEGRMVFVPWPSMVEDSDTEKHTVSISKDKILVPFNLRKDFLEQVSIMHGEKATPAFILPQSKIITR